MATASWRLVCGDLVAPDAAADGEESEAPVGFRNSAIGHLCGWLVLVDKAAEDPLWDGRVGRPELSTAMGAASLVVAV
jgi:hypothetical protein